MADTRLIDLPEFTGDLHDGWLHYANNLGVDYKTRSHEPTIGKDIWNAPGGSGEITVSPHGVFIWDATAMDAPDQLSVICPISNTTEQTESVSPTSNNATSLAQTGLILGQVNWVDTVDGTYTVNDWRLHNSTFTPNVFSFVEHKTGTIYGFTSGVTFDITYRYASSPGRWKRIQWGPGGAASPSMLQTPGTGNEGHYIAWCLRLASALGRDVFIDRKYIWNNTIQVFDNQKLFGRGMSDDGLEADVQTVMDAYRTDKGNYSPADGATTQLESTLGGHTPLVVVQSGAKYCKVEELQINGRISDYDWTNEGPKLVWPDATGTNPTGVALEDSVLWDRFQDSPSYGGLQLLTNQNGQVIDGLKVEYRNCWVHSLASVAIQGHVSMDMQSSLTNFKCGDIMFMRGIYGWTGQVTNLEFNGYFRFDLARWYTPARVNGLLYRAGTAWPYPPYVLPTSNAFQQTQFKGADGTNTTLGNLRDGRDTARLVLQNIDIDCDQPNAMKFGNLIQSGAQAQITGTLRGVNMSVIDGQNTLGESEYYDVDLVTTDCWGASFQTVAVKGDYTGVRYKHWNRKVTNRFEPVGGWGLENSSEWASELDSDLRVSCERDPSFTAEHAVQYDFDVQTDYRTAHIIHLPGHSSLLQADIMPATIRLTGRLMNAYPRLYQIGSGSTDQPDEKAWADKAEGKVEIIAEGLIFNMDPIPSGEPWQNWYDEQLRIFKMHNCRTWSGSVSEQAGIATWSSGAYIDVPTKLMWRPRSIHVTPQTADAVTFYNGFEWITTGSGDYEDATNPTLRIHLNATPTTEDIKFSWSAAVSPA